MSEPLNALIVEDSEDDTLLVLRELQRDGFNVLWERVETADALHTALIHRSWDVIISDYRLPGFDASAALKIVRQSQTDLPFIVVSGTLGETSAVALMKAGAQDYLLKDSLVRLPEAVRREVREARIRTERKQAAIDLNQTKERLQLAIEGAGIGLWDWDVQTGTVVFNDRWAEIMGYTLEELQPISLETWQRYTHPEDLPKATLAMERHFRKETPAYECEVRMRHKLGLWVWVLTRGKVVDWDTAGKPLRIAGTHLDITDRKRTEATLQQINQELEQRVALRTAALQQSEARLREAHQVARLGSWEVDALTGEITWSAEIFNIFGRNPDTAEPTYEELLDYFPPNERSRLSQLIDRAIQYGEPYTTDLQILRADGSSGYIFAKAEAIQNSEGQVIRLFGIVMDISDRKAMQTALERSEESARATLLALPDVVFRVNHAGQFVDFMVSPPGKNLVDPTEAMGKYLHEVVPINIAQNHYVHLQQALTTQTVQSYEQQVWLGGNLCYEEVRVVPCGNDKAVFFVRDISLRKQAEAQLQKTNAELARATRLKDEFLANMSHELRTPLTAILGMSEILQEKIFGELNAKQHQYLEIISESGKHLLQLINDILDLSKMLAGKLELDVSPVSVKDLCASSLIFVQQHALKKQIQLTTTLSPDLGDLYVDERRIHQVLINLLNNAVKFTPVGGQVTLEVRIQDSGAGSQDSALADSAIALPEFRDDPEGPDRSESLDSGSWILFSVADTGIGIAPDDQAKLFQPFVQIDSTLNRHYEGTGLGLALVKQIVDLHGGSVSLTSQLGQGSCFTMRLPYLGAAEAAPPSLLLDMSPDMPPDMSPDMPPSPGSAAAKPTAEFVPGDRPLILLAEDNQGNIDVLSSYFQAHGYRILMAREGQEAIDLTQAHCPDLILMDIQMPGISGLEAIQAIRRDPQRAQIPIIALTALAMEGDRDRCLEAGANDYLAKPVKLKQLTAVMQQLLS